MKRKMCIAALVAFLIGSMAGCVFVAGAAAGGAGYYWYQGELSRVYAKDLGRVHDASLAALEKDFRYPIISDTGSEIKANVASNKDVVVKLRVEGRGVTKVGVRVWPLPDRALSQLVLSKISQRLGE